MAAVTRGGTCTSRRLTLFALPELPPRFAKFGAGSVDVRLPAALPRNVDGLSCREDLDALEHSARGFTPCRHFSRRAQRCIQLEIELAAPLAALDSALVSRKQSSPVHD
jgi:hypothetical protein